MKTVLLTTLITSTLIIAANPRTTNLEHGSANFWKNARFIPDPADSTGRRGRWEGWFHQDNIDVSRIGQGIIRARVEGRWQEFRTVELPVDFQEWNFSRRRQQIDELKRMLSNEETGMSRPEIAGPHNAIVASHGMRRNDSYFSLNNAVKGTGWLPKPEKLGEMIELLRRTWNDSTAQKLALLESLYTHATDVFDLTKQSSLELYSTPGFETHTFLNQMTDPGVAVVFLDLPKSYELRCIAQLLHPDDPGLSDYERQVVEYVNLVHDYFHGQSPRRSIAVIYHVVQVFDNSPGRWRGQRIVPPLER
ncbi:MAG: hypothetical protein ABIK43_01290 [candidate division WOR-3 bacterium]